MKAKKNECNCEQNICIVSSQIKCENIIYLGYIISFKCLKCLLHYRILLLLNTIHHLRCGNAHDVNFWTWLVDK